MIPTLPSAQSLPGQAKAEMTTWEKTFQSSPTTAYKSNSINDEFCKKEKKKEDTGIQTWTWHSTILLNANSSWNLLHFFLSQNIIETAGEEIIKHALINCNKCCFFKHMVQISFLRSFINKQNNHNRLKLVKNNELPLIRSTK